MLRADVEHHVGGVQPGARADGDLAQRFGGHAGHRATRPAPAPPRAPVVRAYGAGLRCGAYGVPAPPTRRATAAASTPTGCSSHQCPPRPAGSVSSAATDAAASARTYLAGSVVASASGGRRPSVPSARIAV